MDLYKANSTLKKRLKKATKKLIDNCGGVQEVVKNTTAKQQMLSKYTHEGKNERNEYEHPFASISVVAEMEDYCGNPIVTQILAEVTNNELTPRNEMETTPDWHYKIGRATKEFGDVQISVGRALADNRVEQKEAEEILSEIRDALYALHDLRTHVENHIQKSKTSLNSSKPRLEIVQDE